MKVDGNDVVGRVMVDGDTVTPMDGGDRYAGTRCVRALRSGRHRRHAGEFRMIFRENDPVSEWQRKSGAKKDFTRYMEDQSQRVAKPITQLSPRYVWIPVWGAPRNNPRCLQIVWKSIDVLEVYKPKISEPCPINDWADDIDDGLYDDDGSDDDNVDGVIDTNDDGYRGENADDDELYYDDDDDENEDEESAERQRDEAFMFTFNKIKPSIPR